MKPASSQQVVMGAAGESRHSGVLRRWLLGACLALVAAVAVWFAVSVAVRRQADRLTASLQGRSVQPGVKISELGYSAAGMRGLRSMAFSEPWATVNINGEALSDASGQWHIRADRAVVHWRGLLSGELCIRARGLSLRRDGGIVSSTRRGNPVPIDDLRFEADEIRLVVPARLRSLEHDLRQNLRALAARLFTPVAETTTEAHLEGGGTLSLSIHDIPARFRLHTVGSGAAARIVADPGELASVLGLFGDPVTTGDVELIARYPFLLPRMLKIKVQAGRMMEKEYGKYGYQSRQGDAYRHLVWSYLLCEAFGEDFARAVTEAHETSSSNSGVESSRDRRNNELGREYWRRGVPLQQLVLKVTQDPRVAL